MKKRDGFVSFSYFILNFYFQFQIISFLQKKVLLNEDLYEEDEEYKTDDIEEDEDSEEEDYFFDEDSDYDDIRGDYVENDDMDEDKYYYGDDYEE